jgi:hypothetical protein
VNLTKACKARIEKTKEGDCEPWYFDYWKCIDKCVSADLCLLACAERQSCVIVL